MKCACCSGKKMPCKDCAKDTHLSSDIDYYMVENAIWKKYGGDAEFLCWDCLEKRMGRKIQIKDIVDCNINKNMNKNAMVLFGINPLKA